MQENYNEVPSIISGKDLDYLSDMFNWNFTAYKNSCNASNNVIDNELKMMLDKSSTLFNASMNNILSIINGGNSNE